MKLITIALLAASAAMLGMSAPAQASKMDSRIESAAQKSHVFKTYLKGDDVKVASKDGVVTLTGSVAENSHRSLAQETVSDLPGVKSVDNKLTVKNAAPENSDAWLADKLRITLLFHRSVSAGKTDVDVKNGVATLRGAAASQAQKELTTQYAKDVDGITDVKNEMTVKEDPKAAKRTTGERIDDTSITAQVKMALIFHHSTSFLKTTVTTKNGIVTLGGKAKNTAEKDLVTKLVKDINGVKDVNNMMTAD